MIIEFEGSKVEVTDEPVGLKGYYGTPELVQLNPGDLYMAKRNTGWHLLTCKFVKYVTCADVHGSYECVGTPHPDYVMPVEPAYPYDADECFKVLSIS